MQTEAERSLKQKIATQRWRKKYMNKVAKLEREKPFYPPGLTKEEQQEYFLKHWHDLHNDTALNRGKL